MISDEEKIGSIEIAANGEGIFLWVPSILSRIYYLKLKCSKLEDIDLISIKVNHFEHLIQPIPGIMFKGLNRIEIDTQNPNDKLEMHFKNEHTDKLIVDVFIRRRTHV